MHRWVGLAAALLLVPGCAGCSSSSSGAAPPGHGAWVDYQLGGAYPPVEGVAGVVRDRSDPPAPGLWSACYVNAFQTQPGETAFGADLLLHQADGSPVEDPDWPGEFVVDISTPGQRDRVLAVVGPWFDGCRDAGYDAVEPDNLDSWTRSGSRLDAEDAAAMARLLVARAHADGLAIAQKNAPELDGRHLGSGLAFDYAVAEDCQLYDECDAYTDAYGGSVLEVEYTDDPFERACLLRAGDVSIERRDRDVSPPSSPGHVARWC